MENTNTLDHRQTARFHERAGLSALVLTFSSGCSTWLLLTPQLAAPWHALGIALVLSHWLAIACAWSTLPADTRSDSLWSWLLVIGVLTGLLELACIGIAAAGLVR